MKKIQGKIAVVTGSSRGIGKEIALELARCGATIILNASKKSKYALDTLKQVKKINLKSKLYIIRVENFRAVSDWAKKLKVDFGHIDILVNNAGIIRDKTLVNMTFSEWDEVIKVNLYGIFNCTSRFLPYLSNGGRIVNISSVNALTGRFGQTNYAASKAGIIGFTKSLSLEVAKRNITVNAICPGYVDTDMVRSVPAEIIDSRILPKIPLRRLARPQEIAHLVSFLCSDEASYITGQAISINGGLI